MNTIAAKEPSPARGNGSCLMFAFVFGALLCTGFTVIAGIVAGAVYFRSMQRQQVAQQELAVTEALQAQIEADMARSELLVQEDRERTATDVSNDTRPSEQPQPADAIVLAISIDAQGAATVGGHPFDAVAVRQRVQELSASGNRIVKTVIRADRNCRFGEVASVMAICRAAGVAHMEVKAADDP